MNKDSRETNSIRNFTVGTFNQMLLLFLNLVSKSIFIKTLGPVFMGLNGLFTNIFLLLSFAEFGLGSVMVYSLYTPISQEDKSEIATMYHFFKKIYIILSGITIMLGVAIIPLLPLIIRVDQAIPHVVSYYILYLIGIIISNVYMYNSHIILADQRGYILSLYGLIFEGVAMVVQVLFLLTTQNYAVYLMIFIIRNLLYALAINFRVRKAYPFLVKIKNPRLMNKEEKRTIYAKILDVFSYKIARVFITGTDNILISTLVGTIWVGYYSNYDLIIMGLTALVTTFYSGISASIGNLIAKEDKGNQYHMFEIIQIMNIWITGFTATGLYVLFQDFISLWIGKEYLLDFNIVILIIINFYLVCNRKSITLFREASGLFDKIKYAVFLGAGMNLILSIVLGKLMGLSGILIGTIVSALVTYYWYEARILIKDTFSSSMWVFIKNQSETLLYTCLSILITSIGVSWIKDVTIFSFIIKLLICLVIPNVFYILVLRKKDQFRVIADIGIRNYQNIRKRWGNG